MRQVGRPSPAGPCVLELVTVPPSMPAVFLWSRLVTKSIIPYRCPDRPVNVAGLGMWPALELLWG